MVKSRKLNAYLLLVLAFVLGAASGGAMTYGFVKREQVALFDDEGRGFIEERRMHALSRKLDLDDEQRARIADIFEASRDAKYAIDQDVMVRCGGRLEEHRKKLDADIRAVLRTEQRERFDELREKRRERKKGKHREMGKALP